MGISTGAAAAGCACRSALQRSPLPVRPGWRRAAARFGVLLAALIGVTAATAGPGNTPTPGAGAPALPYLAVMADGRILPIAGARLVGVSTVRLDLGGGAYVEVPAARLESIVESATDEKPAVIATPPCPTGFAPQALPAWVPFRTDIIAASKAAGLHPWLVAAVVQAESAFNRWAVSPVGARGLMQLMPSVWLEAGLADPHDPDANLRAGCAHLRRLLDRFGDVTLALAAYNAGAVSVEKSGGVPPYRETREFVRRVLAVFCPPA